MNRGFTNIARFIMDELIPPVIRDSSWFMYPFYYFAYNGKNIREKMNFKSLVKNFTEEEYINFYAGLDSISRNRKTDLSESNIKYILKNIDPSSSNLLDAGCGRGYLLQKIKQRYPDIKLSGLDVVNKLDDQAINFTEGYISKMPFADDEFDTVICTHTIEHLLNLQQGIDELVRVTKNQLIIVTPCQKYFYYTLDEHINFFPKKELLTSLFSFKNFVCKKINYDWVYIGYK
jgi:ubiquinone/menaquinone biosynthesis C-methylase UbiE